MTLENFTEHKTKRAARAIKAMSANLAAAHDNAAVGSLLQEIAAHMQLRISSANDNGENR